MNKEILKRENLTSEKLTTDDLCITSFLINLNFYKNFRPQHKIIRHFSIKNNAL